MTQQHPPSRAPSRRYDQQRYEDEPKRVIGLVQEDPWSQWAPLGAIPRQYQPPAPLSFAKTRWRKWSWSVGVLLAFFVIVVGNCSRSGKSDGATITQQVPLNIVKPVTPTQLSIATAPSAAVPATSSVRNMSFGDGFWIVGEDVVPGTYESGGARPDAFGLCLVTAHTGKGRTSEILDALTVNAREPVRLSLDGKQVRAVETSGCESFTKVG